MDPLANYIQNDLPTEQRELRELEALIDQTSRTLVVHFNENIGWLHRLAAESSKSSKTRKYPSHFATALISVTLWKLLDAWDRPPWRGKADAFPSPIADPKLRIEIHETAWQATELLLNNIQARGPMTVSSTYGNNDPFTLSYLVELDGVRATLGKTSVQELLTRQLSPFIQERRESLFEKVCEPPTAIWEQSKLYKLDDTHVVPNAMIAMRVAQTLTTRPKFGLGQSAIDFRKYFENVLHQQLSYSSIPDSRFDPAELTFALEGLLVVQGNAVDRGLFTRVTDVLRNAQENSAFWRPVKPFLATEKGMALFPVSVEVANSLIRSCEMFDKSALHNTVSSACVPLFHRYFQWLQARTVRITVGAKPTVGWHSEHINELGAIHTWETSLVLEFLLDYRRLLQAHIARQMLLTSRVLVQDFSKMKLSAAAAPAAPVAAEPVSCLGDDYKINHRIREAFHDRRKQPQKYSMLLYGPPGTGKTTIAERLAKTLGYRLITITVSNFLTGDAELEARAQSIFSVLAAQPDCVVLFDEIDHFLLDRELKRYSQQLTTFQFMTPGMLTKIQNLRSSERVIFIVATNYENRIDAAIKRTGRIDERYLVLPPDASARVREIETTLNSLLNNVTNQQERTALGKQETTGEKRKAKDRETAIRAFRAAIGKDKRRLEAVSLFLGYRAIKTAVLEAANKEMRPEAFLATLADLLRKADRSINLTAYATRLADDNDASHPHEEFACLLGLAAECKNDLLDQEHRDALTGLPEQFERLELPRFDNWLTRYAAHLSEDIRMKVLAAVNTPSD